MSAELQRQLTRSARVFQVILDTIDEERRRMRQSPRPGPDPSAVRRIQEATAELANLPFIYECGCGRIHGLDSKKGRDHTHRAVREVDSVDIAAMLELE